MVQAQLAQAQAALRLRGMVQAQAAQGRGARLQAVRVWLRRAVRMRPRVVWGQVLVRAVPVRRPGAEPIAILPDKFRPSAAAESAAASTRAAARVPSRGE